MWLECGHKSGLWFVVIKWQLLLFKMIKFSLKRSHYSINTHFGWTKIVIWWLLNDDLSDRGREPDKKETTNSAPLIFAKEATNVGCWHVALLLNILVKRPVSFELVLMWSWKCFYHMNATHRFSSQLCVLSRNIIMADRKRVVGNHLMLLQIACYPYSSWQV